MRKIIYALCVLGLVLSAVTPSISQQIYRKGTGVGSSVYQGNLDYKATVDVTKYSTTKAVTATIISDEQVEITSWNVLNNGNTVSKINSVKWDADDIRKVRIIKFSDSKMVVAGQGGLFSSIISADLPISSNGTLSNPENFELYNSGGSDGDFDIASVADDRMVVATPSNCYVVYDNHFKWSSGESLSGTEHSYITIESLGDGDFITAGWGGDAGITYIRWRTWSSTTQVHITPFEYYNDPDVNPTSPENVALSFQRSGRFVAATLAGGNVKVSAWDLAVGSSGVFEFTKKKTATYGSAHNLNIARLNNYRFAMTERRTNTDLRTMLWYNNTSSSLLHVNDTYQAGWIHHSKVVGTDGNSYIIAMVDGSYKLRLIAFNYDYSTAPSGPEASEEMVEKKLDELTLSANYPNPVGNGTTIEFYNPREQYLTLFITDITGKRITDLLSETITSGKQQFYYDTSSLASGIYFYTLMDGEKTITKKLIKR